MADQKQALENILKHSRSRSLSLQESDSEDKEKTLCLACECDILHALKDKHPATYQTIMDIALLLLHKGEDYSGPGRSFSAFTDSALASGVDVDTVFRTLIGVKTAREKSLLASGNKPNYESLKDTRIDRAAYCILQCAYDSTISLSEEDRLQSENVFRTAGIEE